MNNNGPAAASRRPLMTTRRAVLLSVFVALLMAIVVRVYDTDRPRWHLIAPAAMLLSATAWLVTQKVAAAAATSGCV